VEPGLSSADGRWLAPVPPAAAARPAWEQCLSYHGGVSAFTANGCTSLDGTYRLTINDGFPSEIRGGAVSVGNFDGVHRGHAVLMAVLRERARTFDGPAVVVTFDPHPLALLAPERFLPLLSEPGDRAAHLRRCGADAVVLLRTTDELLRKEPLDFLEELLSQRLEARGVVEGFNFGFGRGRAGTTALLHRWCEEKGIACDIIPALTGVGGQTVSSSRVRAALDRGDVAAAADLLGRPYRLRGVVTQGDRRGTQLGFPTANLGDVRVLVPGDGVYAVRAATGTGEFAGAANIGPNPTFGVSDRKIEVHLIGYRGDLYGTTLAVDFLQRLRDTRAFGSKDELVGQLRRDVERATSIAGGPHAG
jgi:riboflavin kinase/FMN adenylyltransferase